MNETERHCGRELADQPRGAIGQQHAGLRELEHVGPQHRADVDVVERRRNALVDDAHHLLGSDAVGRQRGDERAGAGADVDVELVDGPVDGQQVEGAQGADLVDAAGETAAAEDEGGLRASRGAARAALAPWRRRAALPCLVQLHHVVHRPRVYGPRGSKDTSRARDRSLIGMTPRWPVSRCLDAEPGACRGTARYLAIGGGPPSAHAPRLRSASRCLPPFAVPSGAFGARRGRSCSARWSARSQYGHTRAVAMVVRDLTSGTTLFAKNPPRRGSRRRSRSSTRRRPRCGCSGRMRA